MEKLVPRLRFPGFEDDWENHKVSELISLSSAKFNPEKNIPNVKSIELEHLSSNSGELLGFNEGATLGSIKNKFKKDEILFGKLRPYLRKYLKAPFDGVCSSEIWVLNGKKVSNDFLFSIVQTETFMDLVNVSSGSKMPRSDWKVVSSGTTYIPKSEEQKKIADFLSTISTKIIQLKKKKSLLEHYKKGMMQKIFDREVRFRDDDGKEFQEWDEFSMLEVFKKKTKKNVDGKITTVLTNSAVRGIVLQQDYFDKDIAQAESIRSYYIVDVNDFVYNPRISEYAPVGPFKRNKITQGIMSPLYSVFTVLKGNLDFYQYYFETTLWHDYMSSIANFGARHDRMNIKMADFEQLPLPFPDLKEQLKIANFLSAIDDKINLVGEKVERMEKFKKGLLREMFV